MLAKSLARVLAGVVALLVVALAWFALQVDPIFAGRGREVTITVRAGDSFSAVASQLHAKGVIASPLALRIESLFLGAPIVRVGTYQLRQGSSFATVRAILGARPNLVSLAVWPGLTLREITRDVANLKGTRYAHAFAAAASDARTPSGFAQGNSLEGLVGAGTYVIRPSTTPRALARAMVSGFATEAASVGLTPTTTTNGLDAYQLIVAASIVEKEGYYPRNMPKVARVIFNRLARGGPLQMDSTVLYALGRDGGTVTHAMLATSSPYNTYLNSGLTPTPICTVSRAALRAVLHAPAGPWLYFVRVDKKGDEAFAATFAQQLRNEQLAASRGVG